MNFGKDVIEKYIRYLKQNRMQIEKQQHIVEQILDDKFDLVYDFFYAVLASQKQYKILRARRCQVLFYIFLPIILINEEDLKPVGTFISHNSMIKYKASILNSSAVIIDDILIHGRGLKQIYERLDPRYEHASITTFVLYKSKEAGQNNGPFWRKLRCVREVFDWEWIALSCQFVNMIYASTSPYISFVGSYVKNGAWDYNICENTFEVHKNTNDAQRQQGEDVFILYEKDTVLPLFANISYDCCLRIYENKKIEKVTCIPYVFLKNIDCETSKNLFQWICDNINSEKTKFIRDDLLNDFRCKEGTEYQIRLFAALINQIYGLYLENKYNYVLSGAAVDCVALSMVYGMEIANELCHITYDDIKPLLLVESPFSVEERKINEDLELETIWKKLNNKNEEEIKDKLFLYFYENRVIDEERASKMMERKKGLSVGYFYNEMLGGDKHKMSSAQVGKWDSGVASCCVYESDDEAVAFYNVAGEQSFRYILEKFPTIMDELIFLYNKPLSDSREKSGVNLVNERMKQLRKDKKKEYSEEEWKALEKFVEKNVYRLGVWRLP